MLQIEKFKAEAEELRSCQQTLGNPIKHFEALEQVAKKYDYSSWRACRASLGDDSGKPDDSEAAPPMKQLPKHGVELRDRLPGTLEYLPGSA